MHFSCSCVSLGLWVCPVIYGKFAKWIVIPSGVMGRVGPRMCMVDGDAGQGGCGVAHYSQRTICGVPVRETSEAIELSVGVVSGVGSKMGVLIGGSGSPWARGSFGSFDVDWLLLGFPIYL